MVIGLRQALCLAPAFAAAAGLLAAGLFATGVSDAAAQGVGSATDRGASRQPRWTIDIPQEIRGRAKSAHAPLSAEIVQSPAEGAAASGWLFGQVVLTVPLVEGGPAYLKGVGSPGAGGRLVVTPEKAEAKQIPLLLSSKIPSESHQGLKLRVENHATEFQALTISSRQTSAKFNPRYQLSSGEPFILVCAESCTSAQAAEALNAYDSRDTPTQTHGSSGENPPKNDRFFVFAYDESGNRVPGPFAGIGPTCDTNKLRSGSAAAGVVGTGLDLELPSGNPTFCVMVSPRRDAPLTEYRCESRPRLENTATQVPIPVGVGLKPCPPPRPRLYSVQVVDQSDGRPVKIDLQKVGPSIFRSPVKSEGTWETPADQEIGGRIGEGNISLQNKDFEPYGPAQVDGNEIKINIRRVAVGFSELSFRLIDDLGTAEPYCLASLLLPRQAVRTEAPLGGTGPNIELQLVSGAAGHYLLTADQSSGSGNRRTTPEARLVLAHLPERPKLSMAPASKACKLNPQGEYPFSKAELVKGEVTIKVALARPGLDLVLVPDRGVGSYIEPASRNRLWSDVILKAFREAAGSEGNTERWREIRVSMLTANGPLRSLGAQPSPISGVAADIVDEVTKASDQAAEQVPAVFEDTLLSRVAGSLPEAARVVVIAGQKAERFKFCEGARAYNFLNKYPRTTVVLLDLLTADEQKNSSLRVELSNSDVLTCAGKPAGGNPGAPASPVRYFALAVPQAIEGQARREKTAMVLAEQFRTIFAAQANR